VRSESHCALTKGIGSTDLNHCLSAQRLSERAIYVCIYIYIYTVYIYIYSIYIYISDVIQDYRINIRTKYEIQFCVSTFRLPDLLSIIFSRCIQCYYNIFFFVDSLTSKSITHGECIERKPVACRKFTTILWL
jgi:hypothetical protein